MLELIKYILMGVLAYVSILFFIALILKNWSIIDIAWGPGFVVITSISLLITKNTNPVSYILFFMVVIWAIRLAGHIGIRNIGKGEDFRYANWRKKWIHYPELQGYFRVFILQGSIMLCVSIPIIITIFYSNSNSSIIFQIPAITLFLIGFFIETVADLQLKKFKTEPLNSGHLIKSGLWKISRHPNYLGEIILWWGIGVYSLSFPYGFIGLLGPLCIHLIIRYISIPVLEEKWEKRKDWQSIKETIPILFPIGK